MGLLQPFAYFAWALEWTLEWTLERAYQWQEAGLCSVDQKYEEQIPLKTGSSADGISDGDGTVMGWGGEA
ncbi:hypothetical protein B5S29_g4540 [[Candida] boidinii]|nr:hypothetical protein B5S29_g4540 [[Candida] boidinii]